MNDDDADDDLLWDYQGPHTAYHGDCQEILLEMQKIFYEDLKSQPPIQGSSYIELVCCCLLC